MVFFYFIEIRERRIEMDTQISAAITQVINTVKNIANPIATLSLIAMGLYLAAFGENQNTIDKVKRWFVTLAVGMILINLAEPIVKWLESIH